MCMREWSLGGKCLYARIVCGRSMPRWRFSECLESGSVLQPCRRYGQGTDPSVAFELPKHTTHISQRIRRILSPFASRWWRVDTLLIGCQSCVFQRLRPAATCSPAVQNIGGPAPQRQSREERSILFV